MKLKILSPHQIAVRYKRALHVLSDDHDMDEMLATLKLKARTKKPQWTPSKREAENLIKLYKVSPIYLYTNEYPLAQVKIMVPCT